MHHVPQILFCLNGIGNAYRFCTGIGNWEPTNVTECESYSVRYLAQQVPCACVQLELLHASFCVCNGIIHFTSFHGLSKWYKISRRSIELRTFINSLKNLFFHAAHTNLSGFKSKSGHCTKS